MCARVLAVSLRAFALLLVTACATAQPAADARPGPPAPSVTPLEAPSQAARQPALRLPVDGEWIVSQGYHGTESHRGRAAYALDLVKLDARGRAYTGRGKRLQDWYSFGAEIRASADGEVVRASERFADNRLWGRGKDANSIIVRHGEVFSEYVHLMHGSLRVRVGDRVTQGQVLARAGNSGSETPHVHWALLASIEPIRTRPAQLTGCEVRDASGAWRATVGVPSQGELARDRAR